MSTLEYILLFTLIGSIGSLIGGFVLLSREKFALKISHYLTSFAAGTLLGTVFFDLLPEALHESEEKNVNIFLWTLVGIVIFFLIERFVHWFHHHEETYRYETETRSTLPLIIISDTMHNFIDGIVIAATFLVSIPLGIVTTIAVAVHEIPQEIGDFGIMLHKGLPRKKILLVNIISASFAFAGAIITYLLGNVIEGYIAIFIALTAGFFIYIASSDLIPEIHQRKNQKFAIIDTISLLMGIITIWISVSLLTH